MEHVHRGSVLPKIATTRSRGATILDAKPISWTAPLLVVFFFAGAIVNAYFAWSGHLGIGDRIEAALGAFVTVTAGLALLREYRRRSPLAWASLRVRDWPLHLGDEVHVELRGSLRVPVSGIAATLECREEVRTGRDRGAIRTATRYSIELTPPGKEISGAHFTARWTCVIPAEEPPSFDVKTNIVRWRLLVRIFTSEGGEVPAELDLLVLP
jgi:hypothetical protein